jgi:hypothetical protein
VFSGLVHRFLFKTEHIIRELVLSLPELKAQEPPAELGPKGRAVINTRAVYVLYYLQKTRR